MAYPSAVDFKHTSASMGMQPINESSTVQRHPLGLVVTAKDVTYGVGEFVYCVGVASTATGDLCTYDSKNGDTARAVHGGATSTGSCGVAMSDNVASQYGWYQIGGAGPVASGTVAADAPIYLTSTAGSVDDTVVAGDKITGMISRAATSSGYTTVQMDRPSITSESSVADLATVTTTANAAATKAGISKITLSAAVEAAQAIVVSGVVEDLAGLDAAVAKLVCVRTTAATAGKGAITVTVGTELETVNSADEENVCWLETTTAGLFSVSVANDAAENTMLQATANGALAATLKLVFT